MLILSDIPRHTTHSVDYLALITVNPDYTESAPYIFLVLSNQITPGSSCPSANLQLLFQEAADTKRTSDSNSANQI